MESEGRFSLSKGGFMHSFDGHNDVLCRLWRQGNDGVAAFLEGDGKGQLDLPRARAGGMVGGLYATFAPSEGKPQAYEPIESGTNDRRVPPPLELTHAQRATLEMAALLFRIAERSNGGVRIARSVADIRAAKAAGAHAPVLHIEGCEALDGDLRMLDVLYAAGLRSLGPVWSRSNIFGHGVPFRFPSSPDTGDGLTDLGQALIRRCNEMRILIDLSHAARPANQTAAIQAAQQAEADAKARASNASGDPMLHG
jgi:membrane dipeptidase